MQMGHHVTWPPRAKPGYHAPHAVDVAWLGLEHRLLVSGLPSDAEIGVALRRMHAGEMTVAEAMDAGRL
jgi:hypothetical protein